MPKPLSPTDLTETMAAPLGDFIAAVGRGLAEAQQSLDLATINTLKALYAGNNANMELLRQLGWQPTWYRIPELDAEITMSLSISGTATESSGPGQIKLYASPMDANYTNRYDYDLQAASVIRFKIVPVPPSSQAADRKVVPALAGKSFAVAGQLLASLGIPFQLSKPSPRSDENVWETVPDAGEILAPGDRVTLKFYVEGTDANQQ